MRISDWSSDVCSSDLAATLSSSPPAISWAQAGAGIRLIAAIFHCRDNLRPDHVAEHVDRRVSDIDHAIDAADNRRDFERKVESMDDNQHLHQAAARSEERRVGKEGVSTCRSRGSPYH